MGQLWVKLDELKRENDDLRRQRGRSQDDRSSSPKDKGPGDVIINDLQKTRTDNESLRTQVNQLQKALREQQAVSGSLQDEYRRSKAALDAAQRSVEKARHDYRKLEASYAAVRAENEALRHKLSVSSSPAKTSNMVPAVPRTDSRLTENISERCRPSTIALHYTGLESQQWVDAKEAIEDDPDCCLEEADIVRLLCEGLMSTYVASQQLYNNVELVIMELLTRPTLATAVIESRLVTNTQCSPLPEDLADIVKFKLRQTADSVDTDVIISMSHGQQMDSGQTLEGLSLGSAGSKAVQAFLQEAALTTWPMTLHSPPMTLAVNDTRFDDVRHRLWWSCDQSHAHNVDLFVWPVLCDSEGGNILVKGCVCAS
ncbi:uncharacterized protein LOC143299030 isoform X2 [Babylonia areolata]|uniref:uncharacterized protein LOC143299030 isoform X2 n=1 Tax=Babylonia areolata TaxID=304850 RepID=UPI003FD0B691